MEKKLSIFDMDGTIIDGYNAIWKTINFVRAFLGYSPVSYEDVRKNVGGGDKSLISTFFSENECGIALKIYRENNPRFLEGNVKLMNGAEELLNLLKEKGIKIGIATNRVRFSIMMVIEYLKIEEFFDYIVTADSVKNPKPAPDMLLKTLKHFQILPENVFYTGDMIIDWKTGKNAGVDTFIVATGSDSFNEIKNAGVEKDKIFPDLISLKNFLLDKNLI